jgi:hypothetical protein
MASSVSKNLLKLTTCHEEEWSHPQSIVTFNVRSQSQGFNLTIRTVRRIYILILELLDIYRK